MFQNSLAEWFDAVAAFRALIHKIDPDTFTEQQLADVDASITGVVTFLEQHLAREVSQNDTTQLRFLGDSIRDLRESKHWIAQGFSPDPTIDRMTTSAGRHPLSMQTEPDEAVRLDRPT